MRVNGAISLNPQSAMREIQNRFRRLNLALRGPRIGLNIGPRSPRGVRSAPFLAQIPNPQTNTTIEG
eukprot:13231496-Alexandrium_andersonii.AAC.1